MVVSESEAFRAARDAYLKGEEDASFRFSENRPSYEERVRSAEDTARVLLGIVTEGAENEVGS